MDNGSITFFDINAFGFYRLKRKAKDLDYKYGSLEGIFSEFDTWLNGKTIEETIPWDVNINPLRSKTYCRGMAIDPRTKDIVIVLLRAVGDGSGNLHGVKMGAAVGAGESDTVKAGTSVAGGRVIWGEPCYYWVIPEYNKIASIIFPHSGADTYRFCQYITTFVNNHSNAGGTRKQSTTSHQNSRDPGKMVNVVKTMFEYGEGKDKCNCIFKFDVEQTKVRAAVDNLEEMIPNITQTIIRDITTSRVEDERSPILQLASEYLPSLFGEAPPLQAPKRIEVRIDGAPSAEEIAQLFAQRADETDWADVGFKVKDSDIPIWLTKYVVKSALSIDSDGLSHYSPERLLEEINNIRADIIESVLAQEEAIEDESQAEIAAENANDQLVNGQEEAIGG
ncbi:hypothetical protein ACWL8E_003583 [Escherichia coli]|uniref:hypothetical protein n=1 Tax=Escherichia coli TaxID=562 RepID=UPI0017DAA79C|nr:hypothetical protein [Escherichia coli]EEV6085261.1 hypothetical protein [Escherichia coli]EFD0637412.1 hypothetical protein [Escherichia coli]